jgi:hypothetical protein
LDLWWYLGRLVCLFVGLGLLVVILLLGGILAGTFHGLYLLLRSRCPCSTRLFILVPYDKLRVEL